MKRVRSCAIMNELSNGITLRSKDKDLDSNGTVVAELDSL